MPLGHISRANFGGYGADTDIKLPARAKLYVVNVVTDRAASFFKKNHNENLLFKISLVILIARIEKTDGRVGIDRFFSLKVIFVLVGFVVLAQLFNGTNDFNKRIFDVLVISVCADVLNTEIHEILFYVTACVAHTGNGKFHPKFTVGFFCIGSVFVDETICFETVFSALIDVENIGEPIDLAL